MISFTAVLTYDGVSRTVKTVYQNFHDFATLFARYFPIAFHVAIKTYVELEGAGSDQAS